MDEKNSMQGVSSTVNQFKPKGRGMMRQTSKESSNSKDNINAIDSVDASNKHKERSRRTKAGYEIYQVKKRTPISQSYSPKHSPTSQSHLPKHSSTSPSPKDSSNSNTRNNSNYHKNEKKKFNHRSGHYSSKNSSKSYRQDSRHQHFNNKKQHYRYKENQSSDTTLSNSLSSKEDWDIELKDDTNVDSSEDLSKSNSVNDSVNQTPIDDSVNQTLGSVTQTPVNDSIDRTLASVSQTLVNDSDNQISASDTNNKNITRSTALNQSLENTNTAPNDMNTETKLSSPNISEQTVNKEDTSKETLNEEEKKPAKRQLTEREIQMKIKGQLLLECPCKYMPEDIDPNCMMCMKEPENDFVTQPPDFPSAANKDVPATGLLNQVVQGEVNTDTKNDNAESDSHQLNNNILPTSPIKVKDISIKHDEAKNTSAQMIPSDSSCHSEKNNIYNNNIEVRNIEISNMNRSKEKLDKSKIDEINALFNNKIINKNSSTDIDSNDDFLEKKYLSKSSVENSDSLHDDFINEIEKTPENKKDDDSAFYESKKYEFTDNNEHQDNPKIIPDEKTRRRSSDSKRNSDQLQRSRQRNFMSSIVSILNENKQFSENHKTNYQQDIPRKYSSDRSPTPKKESRNERKQKDKNKSPNNQRRSDKKKINGKGKQSPRNRQISETEQNWMSDESLSKSPKAGLIYLPGNESTSSDTGSIDRKADEYQRRHVHFDNHVDQIVEEAALDKSKDVVVIDENLSNIKKQQTNLAKLLQKGFQDIDIVKEVITSSEIIQQKYGELILQHPHAAIRNDYEGLLWKSAFHNVILHFRKFLDDPNLEDVSMQEIGVLYWHFLQNGIQFLDELMLQIQEKQSMCLDDYINDPIKIFTCSKKVKLSLRSCHLLLIYIGDLERYICQLRQDDSYKNAQDCYKRAQILAPKNGKSYNQLAVVAVCIKHKLDAVYFYARSLQASNPILTAKERLTAIFYDIRRKADKYYKKQSVTNVVSSRNQSSNGAISFHNEQYTNMMNPRQTDHLRDEVWTFYRQGQMFKVMLTNQNEIIHLTPTNKKPVEIPEVEKVESREERKITLKKINRRFIINFLYVHCKLYTNVGLENFTSVHQESLSDLATLLKYPKTSSMKEENLIKYMAINIFTIHILLEKQGNEDVIPNTAIDLAVTFGMDMFNVLCKQCVESSDFFTCRQYLAAMRVWLMWMANHTHLIVKSSASFMVDIWTSICNFINILASYPVDVDIVLSEDEYENQYLAEDLLLSGFKPLPNTIKYIRPKPEQLDQSLFRYRINDMLNLISQTNQYGDLPFAFDERDNCYKPIQPTMTTVSPHKTVKALELDDVDETEACEDVLIGEDDEDDDMGDISHIADLKLQKAELEKQIEESERKRQAALSVIESHKSQGRHISENSPTYLVADTNCYIDHLDFIRAIVESKDFTLIVPLIVINELDGLKVGSYYDTTKYQEEHQRIVQVNARIAVDYLEELFSKHDTNIRAITSSGNEMDTIVFRAEEFSADRGTNDDVILSCCLKYCTEHVSRGVGESSVVYRNVVLLTNDRNLRVKAHTRYVPTLELISFMRMARFV